MMRMRGCVSGGPPSELACCEVGGLCQGALGPGNSVSRCLAYSKDEQTLD